MARIRLLTPDAQYADDGTIERETAGDGVDRDIQRVRTAAYAGRAETDARSPQGHLAAAG